MEIIEDLKKVRLGKRRSPYYWEPFMRKYDCQIICEVGVFAGANFKEMIKHAPKTAIAVDSWIDDGVLSRNDTSRTQETLNSLFDSFATEMKEKQFVKIFREYSFDAVRHFDDNYFDLIYIDGDHSFEGCLQDITNWYKKVKPGRFLVGDDYRVYQGNRPGVSFGVIEAVNEFANKNKLDYYLLPSYGWAIIKP